MGAKCFAELSKIQEHKAGLEPTLPHYECGVLAAERPEPAFNWDRTDLNRGHRSAWMPDWSYFSDHPTADSDYINFES